MEAKSKAIELYSKFRNENSVMTANVRAKKQALICIEEIINLMVISFKWDEKTNGNIHFWEEVKDELNKMK